jgi:hypothetical protein
MAINTTWSIINMTHVDADGGVIKAYWACNAVSDGSGGESASEGGKNLFTYDASASGYIAYADLKESDVLGWVWEANKAEGETADEYKAGIEANRTARVQSQIDEAATQATGVPW